MPMTRRWPTTARPSTSRRWVGPWAHTWTAPPAWCAWSSWAETEHTPMANIKRIDHVAIAVKDVDAAVAQYQGLLNATHVRTETLREKAGMVRVAYMQIGENILSLVQSLEPDGFINQHIDKHGEGLHHLGLEVDDLEGFIAQTEERGYKIPLRDEFSNRDEVVLRPRDANGVVLQVLQWKGGSDATVQDRIQHLQNQPE
ncbi:MAG: hypothetical protein CFE45_43155 [Burkholderiales bacterium PBB5]|nr:MAG: hypothetical protein CFE45_43155 [Burkholderiales bacterium PBB5]